MAKKSKKIASMMDVAELSGVSHQTVSRVLNNSEDVSEKTRAKVLNAMAELKYHPNLAARALATGKTATIGVLSHNTSLFGPTSTLYAVQSAAREKGYKTIIHSLKNSKRESIIQGIRELIKDGIDGMVIIAPEISEVGGVKQELGRMPAVLVEGDALNFLPLVNIDQIYGAYSVTKHLISLGHQHIAHISGQVGWYETQERIKGWEKALQEHHLKESHLFLGDWSAMSGYFQAVEIVKIPEITAIFAANDSMALGALKAISEAGRSVPIDLSLVGFDDLPESRYFTPALTTVQQDFHKMGIEAVRLLMSILEEKKPLTKVLITPKLVIRDSSAKVKKFKKV